MRRFTLSLFLLVPALLVLAPCNVSAQAVTNADVKRMVQEGLSDSILIEMMKSWECDFLLTADDIVDLKQAGVSDAVIEAMLLAKKEPEQSPASAEPQSPASAEDAPHLRRFLRETIEQTAFLQGKGPWGSSDSGWFTLSAAGGITYSSRMGKNKGKPPMTWNWEDLKLICFDDGPIRELIFIEDRQNQRARFYLSGIGDIDDDAMKVLVAAFQAAKAAGAVELLNTEVCFEGPW